MLRVVVYETIEKWSSLWLGSGLQSVPYSYT